MSRASRGAFTLLEVIVATGIFAVGMLAVVGLFTPVARSVGTSADAAAASRVADALRIKLQTLPPQDVIALLKNANNSRHELTDADQRSDYDPTKDAQILFASRDGTKIAAYADAVWGSRTPILNPDRDKYYEIALVRNEVLTPRATAVEAPPAGDTTTEPPPDPDTTAYLIAYTARLRWPAFIPEGASNAIQVGSSPTGNVRFDHSQKQVMYFSGSITR